MYTNKDNNIMLNRVINYYCRNGFLPYLYINVNASLIFLSGIELEYEINNQTIII